MNKRQKKKFEKKLRCKTYKRYAKRYIVKNQFVMMWYLRGKLPSKISHSDMKNIVSQSECIVSTDRIVRYLMTFSVVFVVPRNGKDMTPLLTLPADVDNNALISKLCADKEPINTGTFIRCQYSEQVIWYSQY